MFSSIFIDRPRLAFVISIVVTVAGLIAIFSIPTLLSSPTSSLPKSR